SVALTGVALAVLVRVRWGAFAVMVAVAVNVPGLLLVEVAVTVFGSVPPKPGAVVPLTTKVTVAPAASVPRLSLRTPVLVMKACGVPVGPAVVTPVQVTPVGAGSGSFRLTPEAAPSPGLRRTMV